MTLITTLINSNFKCIAGDTRLSTDKGFLRDDAQKVFVLKNAIIGYHDYDNFFITKELNYNSRQLTYLKFISLLKKHCVNQNKYSQFNGFVILKKNYAHLLYFPWNLDYDLINNKPCTNENDSLIKKNGLYDIIFNRKVIINPPILLTSRSIDHELYEKRLKCLNDTLYELCGNTDYNSISLSNYKEFLRLYYSKVFKDDELNCGSIGGSMYIGTLINNRYSLIKFETPFEKDYEVLL